jgi:hypothetical protein
MKNPRHLLLLLGLLAMLGLGAKLSSSQAPAGYTGAPSEQNCTSCHIGSLNSGPGIMNLNLPPGGYVPGQTYSLTFDITDNTKSRFGFSMTSLNGSNQQAGTFTGGTGSAVQTANIGGSLRRYINQQSAGTRRNWSFQWTAPNSNVGPVTFYVTGNAANNNGSTSGDNIYTNSFTLSPASVPPIAGISASQSQICLGSSVQFADQSSGTIGSYSWDFGAGATPATASGQGPHQVSYATSGPRNVQLIVSGSAGADTSSLQVEVFDNPSATISGPASPLCEGEEAVLRGPAAPAMNPYQYSWSSGASIDSIVTTLAGAYQLTVTDSRGCTASDTFQLTFFPLPQPSIQGLDSVFCLGSGAVPLTASPGGGAFTGAGVTQAGDFYPDSAGIGSFEVVYTYQDMNGCIGRDTQEVEVFAPGVISGTNLPRAFCENEGSLRLQSTPGGAVFSGPGISNNVFSPSSAGVGSFFIVYELSGANGCAAIDSQQVRVNPKPNLRSLNLPTAVCELDGPVRLQSDPAGAVFGGPGVFNNTFFPDSAGPGNQRIRAVLTDTANCSDTLAASLLVNPSPRPQLVSSGADASTTQPYALYQWAFVDSTTGDTFDISGATRQSISFADLANEPNNTGLLIVTVTASNGCQGTSEPLGFTTSLSLPQGVASLELYPNPGSSFLQLAYRMERAQPMGVRLFSANGQLLRQEQVEPGLAGRLQWQVSELPAGLYLLQVQVGNESVVRKWLKR